MIKIKTVNMRDKIEQILSQMAKGECEPEETIDSLLALLDVSGFTAADMERAYNDGKADGEVQKDIPFNIEYYR